MLREIAKKGNNGQYSHRTKGAGQPQAAVAQQLLGRIQHPQAETRCRNGNHRQDDLQDNDTQPGKQQVQRLKLFSKIQWTR